MKILADESLDGPVVAWLRAIGHDVLWAVEESAGASDESLMARACETGRVIITSDRDFGDLVFRCGARPPGIALLRIRARSGTELLRVFRQHWPAIETSIHGHFVVVRRGRVRARPLA